MIFRLFPAGFLRVAFIQRCGEFQSKIIEFFIAAGKLFLKLGQISSHLVDKLGINCRLAVVSVNQCEHIFSLFQQVVVQFGVDEALLLFQFVSLIRSCLELVVQEADLVVQVVDFFPFNWNKLRGKIL